MTNKVVSPAETAQVLKQYKELCEKKDVYKAQVVYFSDWLNNHDADDEKFEATYAERESYRASFVEMSNQINELILKYDFLPI